MTILIIFVVQFFVKKLKHVRYELINLKGVNSNSPLFKDSQITTQYENTHIINQTKVL